MGSTVSDLLLTGHIHVSLVKFCESTFNLPPMNSRDRASDDHVRLFRLQPSASATSTYQSQVNSSLSELT